MFMIVQRREPAVAEPHVDLTLAPGAFVRLVSEPDWGPGQVQSVIGTRVTVNFEERGKVTLDLRHVRLEILEAPRPPR